MCPTQKTKHNTPPRWRITLRHTPLVDLVRRVTEINGSSNNDRKSATTPAGRTGTARRRLQLPHLGDNGLLLLLVLLLDPWTTKMLVAVDDMVPLLGAIEMLAGHQEPPEEDGDGSNNSVTKDVKDKTFRVREIQIIQRPGFHILLKPAATTVAINCSSNNIHLDHLLRYNRPSMKGIYTNNINSSCNNIPSLSHHRLHHFHPMHRAYHHQVHGDNNDRPK